MGDVFQIVGYENLADNSKYLASIHHDLQVPDLVDCLVGLPPPARSSRTKWKMTNRIFYRGISIRLGRLLRILRMP